MHPSPNKRVSGYVSLALRPNPSLSLRASDTRNTLAEMPKIFVKKEV